MTVTAQPRTPTALASGARPAARGKFLFVGEDKLYVRGVTYGTFAPADDRADELATAERDFALMAENGINAIRTYTVPSRAFLDAAARHGLRVLVGIPWEQHVTFLDDRRRVRGVQQRVRAAVRACAGHPAVLAYAVGNEIPAPIVRWHGRRRVERFLRRLVEIARDEDPGALITYVNYPSTEYLELPFVDVMCFNVFLEDREPYEAYLARLQNIAGERPLLITELGLDSRTHGEEAQAESLDWQVRGAFAAGAAGAFVFSWTDEWHRGGYDVVEWDFGLTTRDRRPKPSLDAVRAAFAEVPFPRDGAWPRISVVVCSYNGSRTIRDCFEGLMQLDYPEFEVIVVDDGSTDDTAAIAERYPFRLIRTPNQGLSAARNVGLAAATGEIVAYIDDDARADPHWLRYLAWTFMSTAHAGVGGPNIAPPGDGWLAECVANAPGGPVQVLLTDTEAEHIVGCNSAFRVERLRAIGGFDPVYRVAGDDVDVCWRLQEPGWTLGFSHAAMVWHHRRNSLRAYWRQQKGYGKAEALLERKWPERYNAAGHLAWGGRLYGRGPTIPLPWRQSRVYQGTWGTAPFQSLYAPAAGGLASLALMPEWYLVIAALAALTLLGLSWPPLLLAAPLLIVAVGAVLAQAALSASRATFSSPRAGLRLRAVTAFLHVLQPLARLIGRIHHGLTPWRQRGERRWTMPRVLTWNTWSEHWQAPDVRLQQLQAQLRDGGAVVLRGGAFDAWDLEVRGGTLGSARLLMATEEHGSGRQMLRFRAWPRVSPQPVLVLALVGAFALGAALSQALMAAVVLSVALAAMVIRVALEAGLALGTIRR